MRLGSALAIGILVIGVALRPALPEAEGAAFLSAFAFPSGDPRIGGVSALAVDPNGRQALALTDRGHLLKLQLDRQDARIVGLRVTEISELAIERVERTVITDTEGLALGADGTLHVSFEQDNLVRRYSADATPGRVGDPPVDFRRLGRNRGLEALAINARGHLFTLPEHPSSRRLGFPLWRWDGQGWSRPFHLPARDGFWAVSADFGPDGRFYLLERRLTILGFQSRLRRWTFADGIPSRETSLLTTRAGEFGNLEGLSLWRDGAGRLRATMVSDNNFRDIFRMHLVEFVLTE